MLRDYEEPRARYACECKERRKYPEEREWEIWQHLCNHSAFSGYRYTPSDYSQIHCRRCGAIWRTKAKYVVLLKLRKADRE